MKIYTVIITAFDMRNKWIGKYSRGVLEIKLFSTYQKAYQFIKEYFKDYLGSDDITDNDLNNYQEKNSGYEDNGWEIIEMEVE